MSVRFDATDDGYSATTGLPAGQVHTTTFWAYLSVDQDTESPLMAFHGGTTTDLGTGTTTSGTVFQVYDHTVKTPAASTSLVVGQWSQVAIAQNGTATSLYTGDAGGALTLTSLTRAAPNPATQIRIGEDRYGGFINGRIAAFKQWTVALTLAEITAELAQFAPVRTANLLRYHPFHVAELTDYSGNGNTLTTIGAPTTEADPPIPEVVSMLYPPQPYTARRRSANW